MNINNLICYIVEDHFGTGDKFHLNYEYEG